MLYHKYSIEFVNSSPLRQVLYYRSFINHKPFYYDELQQNEHSYLHILMLWRNNMHIMYIA